MTRLLFPLVVALLIAVPSPAQNAGTRSSEAVTVTALAVEETDQGFVGTHATVEATALGGGSGRVYVSTKPLAQTDMQGSARLAAQVAGSTLGVDWTRQDYLVSFSSDSTVIGGPSAGADMALALTTALHNLLHPDAAWSLDSTVAATGTINPDGTIGPVGGVPAKAEGAAAAGIKTFLYPAGLDIAPTLKGSSTGVHQVQVEMAPHCAELGIQCHSVSTLAALIEEAAHVQFATPSIPIPKTTDYASILSPSVNGQIAALSARIDLLDAQKPFTNVQPRDRPVVQDQLKLAHDQLTKARADLYHSLYYGAATDSFKGAIAAGRAENLTRFYAGNNAESVVIDALGGCTNATKQAQDAVYNTTVTTMNALYAVGAAQERATEAGQLRDQATSEHDNARTFSDWVNSIGDSVFCVERAKTATWWADLRNSFPPGPALKDLAGLAQDSIDQANDMVSYADAVLQGGATDAKDRLDQARSHQLAGRLAAAVLSAVEAESLASVEMQTGGGTQVPASVLDAAQQGAARAIDQARSAGIEPLLAVSLVELASGQPADQTAASLGEYWTARSLALLQATPVPQPTSFTVRPQSGYDGGTLVAFLAMGAVVGVATASVVAVALIVRRR